MDLDVAGEGVDALEQVRLDAGEQGPGSMLNDERT